MAKVASSGKVKPLNLMRRFKVVKVVTVEISIDQRVLDDVLTDEWRASFYKLYTRQDVAQHLAYNLMQGRDLHTLDGFADQPDERARLRDVSWEEAPEGLEDVEEVKEVKP